MGLPLSRLAVSLVSQIWNQARQDGVLCCSFRDKAAIHVFVLVEPSHIPELRVYFYQVICDFLKHHALHEEALVCPESDILFRHVRMIGQNLLNLPRDVLR